MPQVWSPICAISISSPQLEHLMEGKKLAGLMPSPASVDANDMVRGALQTMLCARVYSLLRLLLYWAIAWTRVVDLNAPSMNVLFSVSLCRCLHGLVQPPLTRCPGRRVSELLRVRR